jgi:hypothetical protein
MAKRRRSKKVTKEFSPPKMEEQTYSLDTDSILCLAGIWYNIDQALRECVGTTEKCIPRKAIVAAAKKLGLGKWIPVEGEEKIAKLDARQ